MKDRLVRAKDKKTIQWCNERRIAIPWFTLGNRLQYGMVICMLDGILEHLSLIIWWCHHKITISSHSAFQYHCPPLFIACRSNKIRKLILIFLFLVQNTIPEYVIFFPAIINNKLGLRGIVSSCCMQLSYFCWNLFVVVLWPVGLNPPLANSSHPTPK